jgi:hypothetical protein
VASETSCRLNLYLKFNDFGCNPLGEDAHTTGLRIRTARGAFGINALRLEGPGAVDGRHALGDVGADLAPPGDESQARSARLDLAEPGAIDLVP